jgi:hypothetical protein
VQWPGVRHRANDRAAIQYPGRHRKQFVDPHAWKFRADCPEFAPNLLGSLRLGIERVQLAPGSVDV